MTPPAPEARPKAERRRKAGSQGPMTLPAPEARQKVLRRGKGGSQGPMTRRAGGVASIQSWGLPPWTEERRERSDGHGALPAWTEERRERSDRSDEGRAGAKAPGPRRRRRPGQKHSHR